MLRHCTDFANRSTREAFRIRAALQLQHNFPHITPLLMKVLYLLPKTVSQVEMMSKQVDGMLDSDDVDQSTFQHRSYEKHGHRE